ncbi:phosphoadenosine phosphosulfate reductase domain-containing protein [Azospirillum canadense]|uniref:phosphoadenosine phosphosulfate reductase domain-containing protein n=1 Tax=Azospirillum canadense TaxID=403962 RepID=UPI002227631D|nr:phosphoadenosine phosphosulfate reductase family protein [Azospirillum canadense]MCW2240742.1 3'-phosphoadenosine 5'-phosphosulfate sulfotransferase (PAPS reductase)/FAD synthetase [Azospirillum canadense]
MDLFNASTSTAMTDPLEAAKAFIVRGALVVCNHSGGKDSQRMYLMLRDIVPHEQLLVIHAHLPEVDWEGIDEHIKSTIGNTALIWTQAGKTFFEMVKHRQMWPSPTTRQCTSDLKRGPIEREIRRHLKANPRFGGLVLNCTGIRAEESPGRAKQIPFRRNERNSIAGRAWYDWLPIHELTTEEVFAGIAAAGQKPHWAYTAGMSRLSCCFCVMSSQRDLKTAASLKPALYERYVRMEREIDQTMMMPAGGKRRFLDEIVDGRTLNMDVADSDNDLPVLPLVPQTPCEASQMAFCF